MFSKRREPAEALASERFGTVIDESARIEGRLEIAESVRIDGKILGTVQLAKESKASVAIAESGVVQGDIHAYRVLVAGQVLGNIHALERVELLPSARVSGDISYGSISIAHGAKVAGLLIDAGERDGASQATDAAIRSARAVQAQD